MVDARMLDVCITGANIVDARMLDVYIWGDIKVDARMLDVCRLFVYV